VLSDGTNSYTYGLGRISQQSGNTPEYFLGDALGSVRQLTDQAGAITYSKGYDPYGVVHKPVVYQVLHMVIPGSSRISAVLHTCGRGITILLMVGSCQEIRGQEISIHLQV